MATASIAPSAEHRHTTAVTATICREISIHLRRPAKLAKGKLAISVGCDGTVRFYEVDGSIYTAVFDVDARGEIGWRNNDYNLGILAFEAKIDQFFGLLSSLSAPRNTNTFAHWCSVCYWEAHGRNQAK
jgi:hypothetical protein